jgi:mannose-6-phosphate isomerase-like protein (cupin superfamily)
LDRQLTLDNLEAEERVMSMIHRIEEVAGTVFPAGRHTRVLVGPGGPVEANGFVMGHVTIFPGGAVPAHSHAQEELYFIAAGEGTMEVAGLSEPVNAGSYVYIPSGSPHTLSNGGKENMIMMFCYAPKGVVDHWRQELEKK